jgi:plasmid stability protein
MAIRKLRGFSTTFCLPEEMIHWLDERAERHGTSRNQEMKTVLGAAMDRAAGQGADYKLDELLRNERLLGFEMAQDDLKRYLNEQRFPRAPLGSSMAKLSEAVRVWISSGRGRSELSL